MRPAALGQVPHVFNGTRPGHRRVDRRSGMTGGASLAQLDISIAAVAAPLAAIA